MEVHREGVALYQQVNVATKETTFHLISIFDHDVQGGSWFSLKIQGFQQAFLHEIMHAIAVHQKHDISVRDSTHHA